MINIETNIPKPFLSDAGFITPSEEEILLGVQADINQAFGGNVNPALDTPQGQLARSQSAILYDYFDAMLEIFNGIDPAFASGRMQDALGRLYFLSRNPASSTIVTAEITLTENALPSLKAGTIIATDAVTGGNLYALLEDISSSPKKNAPISVTLSCLTKGEIPCPANSLLLYQNNLGISSLTNPNGGITGKAAEGRIAFENRRAASVALNAMGQNAALLGALLTLDGVEDAQVIDNSENTTQTIQGVSLPPHSLYAVLIGGKADEIGNVFLAKKPPGCATFGCQKVSVTDKNPAYSSAPPSYIFYFDYAQPQNLYINLCLANLNNVPANAESLIASAITAYFNAPDTRPKLGNIIYATDLIYAIKTNCSWARILSLNIGLDKENWKNEIQLPINQIAVTDESCISLSIQ